MAVGVVVRGMTACLSVAAAAVVVALPLAAAVLVAVAVEGVALSLLRSFLQYFVPSIRISELFFHLQHRSGARHSSQRLRVKQMGVLCCSR